MTTKRISLAAALLCLAGLLAAAPDRALTATGTVAKLQSADRALAVTLPDGGEARFLWNADTKINGVLSPGAKVTIRYEISTDGKNVAQQISVSKS